MSQRVSIYALCDPITEEIRYIGKANHPEKRLKGHMRETRRRSPLYDWMGKLQGEGKVPKMIILEVCDETEWELIERKRIFENRLLGTRLLNLADGGDQPKTTREQLSKNAVALNERLRNDPVASKIRTIKRMLSSALKKGYVLESTREKMREAARKNPKMFGQWASI